MGGKKQISTNTRPAFNIATEEIGYQVATNTEEEFNIGTEEIGNQVATNTEEEFNISDSAYPWILDQGVWNMQGRWINTEIWNF